MLRRVSLYGEFSTVVVYKSFPMILSRVNFISTYAVYRLCLPSTRELTRLIKKNQFIIELEQYIYDIRNFEFTVYVRLCNIFMYTYILANRISRASSTQKSKATKQMIY